MIEIKKDNRLSGKVIGFIVLAIVFIAAAALFSFSSEKEKEAPAAKEEASVNEEKEIMEANKEVIKDAINHDSERVDKINENDHIIGRLGAPIEYIVYGDFEDPFSADYYATIKKVIENFGDKVVVVFRHFPLFTVHNNAMEAAIASECASDQGKFWEMHDKLFENSATQNLNNAQYKKDAEELGLNIKKFTDCLDKKEHEEDIYKQITAAGNAGVLGIPASFVNGQALPGAYPYDDFVDSGKYNRDGMNTIITRHLEKIGK